MRCNAVLPMQIIIAAALQIFAPQHHPCTRAAAPAVQVPAHCLRITAQSTADDLTSLLCSLLCYTLTSLLCNSCSLLRSGTLKQPSLLGKISASESVLEYHFGIARPSVPATRIPAGQSHHPQHHPQAAPIRRPSPPIPAASAHGTFELTTSLRMTRARDSELEYLDF